MTIERRLLLKAGLGGGALATLALPKQWVRPVVNSVIVPAHAATSGTTTTTTAAPTTSVAPTTTGSATTSASPTTTASPTTSASPTRAPGPPQRGADDERGADHERLADDNDCASVIVRLRRVKLPPTIDHVVP